MYSFNRLQVTRFGEQGIALDLDVTNTLTGWHWVTYRVNSNPAALPELENFETMSQQELCNAVVDLIEREARDRKQNAFTDREENTRD